MKLYMPGHYVMLETEVTEEFRKELDKNGRSADEQLYVRLDEHRRLVRGLENALDGRAPDCPCCPFCTQPLPDAQFDPYCSSQCAVMAEMDKEP